MEQNTWGEISLKEGELQYHAVGDLHFWVQYRDEEIWINHAYSDELKKDFDAENPPKERDWTRWAHKTGSGKVTVMPVFSDLPLVVHSEYSLKVSPNTDIQIFTRVPIWVRISLSKPNYELVELPTVKLSRTWFGSFVEGELCYHATTKARRDLSKVEKKPYLVSCPIMITNKSEEELTFEHFCFRVERLSIFEHEHEFWADETKIIYQGEDMNSEVIMTGKLPNGISKKKLISEPRRKVHKSLATRTFKKFMNHANILGR